MDYDLCISGGTLIDGTGRPMAPGDVGIRDGRIVALGKAPGTARRRIEADGAYVCPGFVDIHTHYDAQILWDPLLSVSPWHGVTTAVIGNCGFGLAPARPAHRMMILRTLEKVEGMDMAALTAGIGPDWPFETFPQYLDAIEARGMAINLAALIGHTPLRLHAMGEEAFAREATDAETAAMAAMVRQAMDAGAIGFATSQAITHNGYEGRPVPSRLASFAEIEALTRAMLESGRGILQATVGPTLFLRQFEQLARETRARISWTALLTGQTGPGGHRKSLERTRMMVEAGLAVVPQVSGRPLNFDFDLDAPFPFEMLALFKATMETDRDGRKRIYADPAFREAFKDLERGKPMRLAGWAGRTVVSSAPGHPDWEERLLSDLAREAGRDPVDVMLDLGLESGLAARFRMAMFNYDEAEVAEVLTDPHTVIGLSDAGAHANQVCDACFATDLLGRWVREKSVLSWERAVQMLTSRPAQVFGITDRGLLAPGRPADVVVFDPARVGATRPKRVHDQPGGAPRLIVEPLGIRSVVVNGVVVRDDGRDAVSGSGPLPGRLLRGGSA